MISKETALARLDELRALEDGWDHKCDKKMTDPCYEVSRYIILTHNDLLQNVSIGDGSTGCDMGVSLDYAGYPTSLNVNVDENGVIDVRLSVVSNTFADNISMIELPYWLKFATGEERRRRNYEKNKAAAAARGEDVSKW